MVTNRSNGAQEPSSQARDSQVSNGEREGKRSFIGSGDERTIKKEDFMKQFNLEAVRAEMNRIKENKANFEKTYQKIMTQLQSPRKVEKEENHTQQERPQSTLKGRRLADSRQSSKENLKVGSLFKKQPQAYPQYNESKPVGKDAMKGRMVQSSSKKELRTHQNYLDRKNLQMREFARGISTNK